MKNSLFLAIPIVRTVINGLNTRVRKYGVNKAARHALAWSHTKITVNGLNNKIKTILQDQPVIVVSNHKYFFDIFYLLSVFPNRKKTYIVISTIFTGFGKHLDKHLLPVSIRHHVLQPSNIVNHYLIRFLYRFNRRKKHSQESAQTFNKKTIITASNHLAQNALILYFPQLKETQPWFGGIGHLLHESSKQMINKRKKLYIVFAHIKGLSRWDFLRLIPIIGRYLPPIHISFMGSVSRKNIWKKQNPRIITYDLEKLYSKQLKIHTQ